MALTRRQNEELLVHGYLREQTKVANTDVPEDIMNICVTWYHIKSYLFKAGTYCSISDDEMKVTYKNEKMTKSNSCYGSIIMPSISDRDIEYQYMIEITPLNANCMIAIGIDDAECVNLDSDFAGNEHTKNYAYCEDGNLYTHETGTSWGIDYGHDMKSGDIITLCYNPCKRTLRFDKNGKNQGIIEDIHSKEGLIYRLCSYMGCYGTTTMHLLP